MLAIAVRTIRGRLPSFAGAIVATALAVALVAATGSLMASALAASGAGRFAAVDAVVQANATIMVGAGDAAGGMVTVSPPPRLPAGLVARVGAVDGVRRAVGDLAFPATAFGPSGQLLSAPGADRTEGHGWASAPLTPYILVAGSPPAGAGEVVIDARRRQRLPGRAERGGGEGQVPYGAAHPVHRAGPGHQPGWQPRRRGHRDHAASGVAGPHHDRGVGLDHRVDGGEPAGTRGGQGAGHQRAGRGYQGDGQRCRDDGPSEGG